jgi:hypothetical protein
MRSVVPAVVLVAPLTVAAGSLAFVGGTSPAAASNVGAAIVSVARGQAGYKANPYGSNCNKFSAYWGSGTPCSNGNRSVAWCADFAAWAWAQAGITGLYGHGIDANASSFRTWGQAHGRWHPLGDGYTPKPGDVAEYADAHVGIYTGGPASTPTVISGNWWYPDTGTGQVYEQAKVTSSGPGANLTGYVSAPDAGNGAITPGVASPDSSHVYYVDTSNRVANAWHTSTGWHTAAIGGSVRPGSGVESPVDGKVFYVDTSNRVANAWHTSTGWHTAAIGGSVRAGSGMASPDDAHVYYVDTSNRVANAWHTSTGWHTAAIGGSVG